MTNDPFAIFDAWFDEAKASEPNDPNAMALATTNDAGPSVRMVLLKDHDRRGFVFYTNLESRKASDMADDQQVALLFHWKSLRRQVRIEGHVERVTDAESDAYFASRSRDSQLGAWASDQSRPLASRELFEQRFAEMQKRFEGQEVPRPPYWGGYRVVPFDIEFWEDRPYRLHHRRLFLEQEGDEWADLGLLYP